MELQKNYEVRASDCGLITDLSPLAAFRYVEDVCSDFLGELNMSGVYLQRTYGVTWVYTKHKMHLIKPLHWRDKFSVKCFISKISKVTAVMDFAFYSENGELTIYSQLEMCVIELSSGKIAPLSFVGFDKFDVSPSLMSDRFSRMDAFSGEPIMETTIKVCNLDFNLHTNNTEYIRILLDTYDQEVLMYGQICSIEVNYLNQSRIGDRLVAYKFHCGNADKFELKNGDKSILKAQITFLK